jgi:hypothetical protein
MSSSALIWSFLLISAVDQTAQANDGPNIQVLTEVGKISASEGYRTIAASEKINGNTLRIFKTVKWTYEKESEEFLLVNPRGRIFSSCVLYQVQLSGNRLLGGIEYCTWAKSPQLKWSSNRAWIDFPRRIRQPVSIPVTTTEITIHFRKISEGICAIGLPLDSYRDLRCPNDEAPDSK